MKHIQSHSTINSALFFLLGLSLPIKDQYSTIFMILCLAFSLFISWNTKSFRTISKSALVSIGIVGLLVLVRVLGLFYGDLNTGTKEFVRAIPLVIIPLLFCLNSRREIEKSLFYGILSGLLGIMLWCELHVIISIIQNGESILHFLRWPYLNFNFLGGLDLHPAYLGLFIIWALYHTLFGTFISSKYKNIVGVLLTVFLFQLLARNALLLAFGLITVYAWKQRKIWIKLVYTSSVIGLLLLITFQQSYYLRNKVFYAFQGNNSISGANRFERLDASFEVFSKAPFFGVGPGNDNKFRKKEYLKQGEILAHDLNYNAHNQFVEYLSTYGLFGAFIFIWIVVFFGYKLYKRKHWGYLFLWSAFIFSCLTESVLERSMGIKYFALLAGLVIWHLESRSIQEKANHILN